MLTLSQFHFKLPLKELSKDSNSNWRDNYFYDFLVDDPYETLFTDLTTQYLVELDLVLEKKNEHLWVRPHFRFSHNNMNIILGETVIDNNNNLFESAQKTPNPLPSKPFPTHKEMIFAMKSYEIVNYKNKIYTIFLYGAFDKKTQECLASDKRVYLLEVGDSSNTNNPFITDNKEILKFLLLAFAKIEGNHQNIYED